MATAEAVAIAEREAGNGYWNSLAAVIAVWITP